MSTTVYYSHSPENMRIILYYNILILYYYNVFIIEIEKQFDIIKIYIFYSININKTVLKRLKII